METGNCADADLAGMDQLDLAILEIIAAKYIVCFRKTIEIDGFLEGNLSFHIMYRADVIVAGIKQLKLQTAP